MQAFQTTLRVIAVSILGISMIHVVFGVSSEVFLGSGISAESQLDANLDSQNRFYGAAFSLFGAVFWFASQDLQRYVLLLKATLLIFFIAGAVRILSIALIGWPTIEVLVLTAIELIGPPLVYIWLQRLIAERSTAATTDQN